MNCFHVGNMRAFQYELVSCRKVVKGPAGSCMIQYSYQFPTGSNYIFLHGKSWENSSSAKGVPPQVKYSQSYPKGPKSTVCLFRKFTSPSHLHHEAKALTAWSEGQNSQKVHNTIYAISLFKRKSFWFKTKRIKYKHLSFYTVLFVVES